MPCWFLLLHMGEWESFGVCCLLPLDVLQASIGQWMAANGEGDGFSFMTHTFLVSLFLDCPPDMGFKCPNSSTVEVRPG